MVNKQGKKVVFLIKNVEEYGKLISYCIQKDIVVFRTYWDERTKGDICYDIDFIKNRCFYANRKYYECYEECEIVEPIFVLDNYGHWYVDLPKSKVQQYTYL